MTIKQKKEFVENFINLLEDEGDMFFSSGDVETDYNNIVGTINNQGYWAGNAVRYMFNKKLQFEGLQQRMFG